MENIRRAELLKQFNLIQLRLQRAQSMFKSTNYRQTDFYRPDFSGKIYGL